MKLAISVLLSVATLTVGRPQSPTGVSPAVLLGSSKSATPAVSPAATPAISSAAATPTPAPRHVFGPQFFGPGVNNPSAVLPYTAHLRQAEIVVASNPNVRVFVGVDGKIHFTDIYGRKVKVETFGFDGKSTDALSNVVHDPQDLLRFRFEQKQAKLRLEMQEELQEQQQELAEKRAELALQRAAAQAEIAALQQSQNLFRGVQQNAAASPNSAITAPVNQFRIKL